MNRLKDSPFHHWKPKIIHLDLAVDRNDFPFIKENFSPINNRRLIYIGHSEWYKNIRFLDKISELTPNTNSKYKKSAPQHLKDQHIMFSKF